jgi:DNA-binding XRE family transcriptional regulator
LSIHAVSFAGNASKDVGWYNSRRRISHAECCFLTRWAEKRQLAWLLIGLRDVFAANLRRLRREKGLSQEDLAYTADVNRTYLSKLEKGTSYAGLEIIGKLAAVLEVEPAELLRLPPKRGGRVRR